MPDDATPPGDGPLYTWGAFSPVDPSADEVAPDHVVGADPA